MTGGSHARCNDCGIPVEGKECHECGSTDIEEVL